MSGIKQKTYPAEFKESAVKLAIESNNPIAQTARELGIKSAPRRKRRGIKRAVAAYHHVISYILALGSLRN